MNSRINSGDILVEFLFGKKNPSKFYIGEIKAAQKSFYPFLKKLYTGHSWFHVFVDADDVIGTTLALVGISSKKTKGVYNVYALLNDKYHKKATDNSIIQTIALVDETLSSKYSIYTALLDEDDMQLLLTRFNQPLPEGFGFFKEYGTIGG